MLGHIKGHSLQRVAERVSMTIPATGGRTQRFSIKCYGNKSQYSFSIPVLLKTPWTVAVAFSFFFFFLF